MPVPTPPYPLEDVCTTIFNNTLYTYTNQAFQSLELTAGGQWTVLPMGESVTGGVCVKTTPRNNTQASALWIVGGQTNKTDYQGLQRYSFAEAQWEVIRATAPVAQNRLYHNAAYLNTSDSILLFAGTQDGNRQPSSQTFTIKASPPFAVTAYESSAPPGIAPMVMPFTQSKAIYVGGSETNTKVMIFSPSNSWEDSNATLAYPFYNCSHVRATVQNGNDASKTLLTFDMTVFPNSVNRTILMDSEGNPVVNATPIVSTPPPPAFKRDNVPIHLENPSIHRRGNLTVANWPDYNDTLAPSSTRTNYAVARDQSGLTVIAGGNPNDVLCIYKARDNCWVNATEKFSAKAVVSQVLPSPSATSSVELDTNAPTSTSQPSSGSAGSKFPTKIVGAAIGSLLGLALILFALLYLLRWKKKRRQHAEAGHQRRSSGLPNEKMDFQDRGLPEMSTTRQYRNYGHEQQASAGSMSSMAILMGRVGHRRGDDTGNGSFGSDSGGQLKEYKAAISKPKPIPAEQAFRLPATAHDDEKPVVVVEERAAVSRPRGYSRGGRRGSTRRSSGWNRYWSGGSALNILGFGSRRGTKTYDDNRSDRSSNSRYSEEQRIGSQITQNSALVPPLNIGTRPEMQRVTSGSPTVHGTFARSAEMSGKIERPGSVSTLSSYGEEDDRRDAFSSGIPASVHDDQNIWTPVDGHHFTKGRASSNIYSARNFPSTIGSETTFTRPPTEAHPPLPSQHPSDMSWLNLGRT